MQTKAIGGWWGKHRLPPPSHMVIVSSNACYIVFSSCSDISQKATDAKFLTKNPTCSFKWGLSSNLFVFCCWFSFSFCFSSVWFLFPLFLFFPSCFCFVLFCFFYCIWGISVTLRSLGGMSGMFWFNTSLPELSFDKSINICGFWGQSVGMHRKMKQPGCKAGMRTVKLDSAVGSEREDSGVLASGARGWQIQVTRFFKFWSQAHDWKD